MVNYAFEHSEQGLWFQTADRLSSSSCSHCCLRYLPEFTTLCCSSAAVSGELSANSQTNSQTTTPAEESEKLHVALQHVGGKQTRQLVQGVKTSGRQGQLCLDGKSEPNDKAQTAGICLPHIGANLCSMACSDLKGQANLLTVKCSKKVYVETDMIFLSWWVPG